MSLKEVTFYTVICDRCGKDGCAEDPEYAAYFEPEGALNTAEDWDDWLVVDPPGLTRQDQRLHYCRDCWAWNEAEDERVPLPPFVATS